MVIQLTLIWCFWWRDKHVVTAGNEACKDTTESRLHSHTLTITNCIIHHSSLAQHPDLEVITAHFKILKRDGWMNSERIECLSLKWWSVCVNVGRYLYPFCLYGGESLPEWKILLHIFGLHHMFQFVVSSHILDLK